MIDRQHARAKISTARSVVSRDIREYLAGAADYQLQGLYEEEIQAGREENAARVRAEADRRGLELVRPLRVRPPKPFQLHHSRRKSPSQLDREIARALASSRGRG